MSHSFVIWTEQWELKIQKEDGPVNYEQGLPARMKS